MSESDDDEETSADSGWIPWYCGLKGHEFYAEVEEEYIRDNFNLYGLRGQLQFYDHALEMILSNDAPDEDDLADQEYLEIYRDATNLYGLIHSRYVASPRGLQVMREKYLKGTFGTCPRVHCDRQHVLPIGVSEELRAQEVQVFCPKCEQVFCPKHKYKECLPDGSYFGASLPQIFLQSYPSMVPLDPPRAYVARIFGFKLHKSKSMITRKLENDAQAPGASRTGSSTETAVDTLESVDRDG